MALGGEPRAVRAEETFQLVVAFVERVDEVRGRPAGLAAGDRPVVEHDDALAVLREQVGRRQPGDAGADDDHVRVHILIEFAFARRVARRHPDRDARAVVSLHEFSPSSPGINLVAANGRARARFSCGRARAFPDLPGPRARLTVCFCR